MSAKPAMTPMAIPAFAPLLKLDEDDVVFAEEREGNVVTPPVVTVEGEEDEVELVA